MASFRKLENGSYKATIYCGRSSNGKQIRKYVTKPSLKECKVAAREIEADLENRTLLDVRNIRFDKWTEKYLELKKSELAPGTLVSYKMYIQRHFIPFWGPIKIFNINELQIRSFISEKLKTLSPTTVRKLFFVLSDMLQMVLKHKNPAKNIDAPKAGKYKPNVPTSEQFQKLHNAVKNMWDEIPILLAAWGGLRQGEIFALKKDDIDWDNGTIKIDESRAISEKGYIDKPPKSERGVRHVALPKYLMGLLRQHILNNMANSRLFNITPNGYSERFSKIIEKHNEFLNNKDIIYKNKGRNKKAIAEQIIIQDVPLLDVRFHDLRHYHATALFNAQIPDLYAAQRLGHDIGVLKKIYQHLQQEQENKLDDKVRNIF